MNYNVKFLDMDCKKLNCDDLIRYMENKFMPDIVIVSYDYHIPLHTQKALENITKEKVKSNNVEFICCSAENIPLLDNSVDVIICTWVLGDYFRNRQKK